MNSRAGEPEPIVFGSLELEKKTRSRSRLEEKAEAGAAKTLAGSSALVNSDLVFRVFPGVFQELFCQGFLPYRPA